MNRFFKKFGAGVEEMLGIMGLVGIVLMTVGVITRYVLKISIAWSDEFLRTMFVWTYFIGGAMVYSKGGLMRLELLDDFLKKHNLNKLQTAISLLMELFLGTFFSLMTYFVYKTMVTYIQKGTTSSTSSIPAWVLILGMGIGFAMMVCFSIYHIICKLKKDAKTE